MLAGRNAPPAYNKTSASGKTKTSKEQSTKPSSPHAGKQSPLILRYSSPKEYTKGKKLFYYLIMARKTAEESCLNYFKSEPFYTEWINNDCIVFSEKAISNLNTIQQKYYA